MLACAHGTGRGNIVDVFGLEKPRRSYAYITLVECACGPLGAVGGSGREREDRREAVEEEEEEEEEGGE